MKSIFAVVCLLGAWLAGSVCAKAQSYDAASIPAPLRAQADAVRRYRHLHYLVKSPESVTLQYQSAVTVLNPQAAEQGELAVFYDKQSKVRNLSAVLYDANGRIVRKFREKDFADLACRDGFTLYSDNRMKRLEVSHAAYPYTIEWTFEQVFSGFLAFHPFIAYPGHRFSVEQDVFSLTAPPEYRFHVKTANGAPESQRLPDGSWQWQYAQLPALREEPLEPELEERSPLVWIAPDQIYYDGYTGDVSTWENMGRWVWQLLKDRDQLPPETVRQVKALVADAPTTAEKVCRIYRFMQQKTRYVGIQLGIGGFQPFSAEEVERVGYGDCKALSNYMYALLKAAGIPSWYAIIGAGEGHEIAYSDFCSFGQANHVILCVPDGERDTLWLECTNPQQPCYSQGSPTSDRLALLITPQGGRLAPTKSYSGEQNQTRRHIKLEVQADGSATVQASIRAAGLAREALQPLNALQGKEALDWLAEHFPVPNGQQFAYTLRSTDSLETALELDAQCRLSRIATVQGQRLFLPLCPVYSVSQPAGAPDRKQAFAVRQERYYADTYTYALPAGLRADFIPEEKNLETTFGTYHRAVENAAGQLIVRRTLILHKGTFAAEQWARYLAFLQGVQAADQEKAVWSR